jgi:hypothetical protein
MVILSDLIMDGSFSSTVTQLQISDDNNAPEPATGHLLK